MNIKILDSWLRDYLKTQAEPKQIAKYLSLSSVSVERLEKHGDDYLYDIEVTTNRPDLMSVVGLAREARVVLQQNGISAEFAAPKLAEPKINSKTESIIIKNDPKLVNRICAVIMDVKVKPSPKFVIDRLAADGIKNHNNLIDITNYVMRAIGHSSHVFDFDRLASKELIIRAAKPGEEIVTLHNEKYALPGGDIIAVDDKGGIVDLLGIMGLENSVVTDQSKRILFFLNNNDPVRLRKTSMTLGLRSEAVILNEKNTDPELAWDAFLYGISLFEEMADGKVISELVDIYPNKIKRQAVTVSEEKINSLLGVEIPISTSAKILTGLGFETKNEIGSLTAIPPSFRARDIQIPEDLIEEIARIYGYQNIPNTLPAINSAVITSINDDEFFWEGRIKRALKYWGFTEVYTYSMVPEDLITSSEKSLKIKNPLTEEFAYMRQSLMPSLQVVLKENRTRDAIQIFEIANVYEKVGSKLPKQILHLAGVVKDRTSNFYRVKGIIEQLMEDIGIINLEFKNAGSLVKVFLEKQEVGEVQFIDSRTIGFEIDLEYIIGHATLKKTYTTLSKYPPIFEDLAIQLSESSATGDMIGIIKKQSPLIREVTLLDKFENTRTFHIVYQSDSNNLTDQEVGEIREKILKTLKLKFNARLKG